MTTPQPLTTAEAIRRASSRAGSHFFDPATMRAFGSRLLDAVYPAAGGGRSYFVTSERDRYPGGAWDTVRRYTVRVISWRNPSTIGEPTGLDFGAFASRSGAVAAARRLAAADTVGPIGWPCPIDTHRAYSRPLAALAPDGEPVEVCEACAEELVELPDPRPTLEDIAAAAGAYLAGTR